jgi:hypothetical protein
MEKARNLLYYPSSSTISQSSQVKGEIDYSRNGIDASGENESLSSMTVHDGKSGGQSQDSTSPIPSHSRCWGDPAVDGATEWLLKDMEAYSLLVSTVEYMKSTGEYLSGSIDNSHCWNNNYDDIFQHSSLLSAEHLLDLLNAANITPIIDDEGKKSKRRKISSGASDLLANGALEEHSTAAANGQIEDIDNGLDMDVSDSISLAETISLSQNSENGEDGD